MESEFEDEDTADCCGKIGVVAVPNIEGEFVWVRSSLYSQCNVKFRVEHVFKDMERDSVASHRWFEYIKVGNAIEFLTRSRDSNSEGDLWVQKQQRVLLEKTILFGKCMIS